MMEREQSLNKKTIDTWLYLPVRVVDDTMFPLKYSNSMLVKVSFSPKDGKLVVEKWTEDY